MWGGIECTVNRVGDGYFDQMERNGHARRPEDLDAIAALGIRTVRYPVIWERVAPEEHGVYDWSWTDARLERLLQLDVRPIAGLTHHGSGPRHTSLVDPVFPEKLARYARAVAERYPWVIDYTPVNEPLTTARFSGLYGHWYPHGRDNQTFARALINQCRGVILAMGAIRQITPAARLVQTEDLGRVYSTPGLAHIAEFQNHRRWLSLDLLCGRVMEGHPLWQPLQDWGVGTDELDWFHEHRCPPDIVGINHYLTSDRFLDENVSHYPKSREATGESQRYADVEAVRARLDVPVGTCSALREAWARYQLPLAVTEAHLAGTREEQLRWLYEVWHGACQLRRSGADVRAVTAWSLLGAFDWNLLVTRQDGFYEPGVFDVRAPRPRPTGLARLVRRLATNGGPGFEPLLYQPGWWRRPDRLFQPPAEGRTFTEAPTLPVSDMRDGSVRPVVIVGATGTLGHAFTRLCDARGIPYHAIGRRELNLAGPLGVDTVLDETNASALINAAGYVNVDGAETEAELCLRINARSPALMAEACARHGCPFVTFSSDLVFDGTGRSAPYVEGEAVAPLNVYGRSKAQMERCVLDALPGALVIRTSAFFGPWDQSNFVTRTLAALAEGRRVRLADDQIVSPTYVPDLVHAALDLLVDGESGIWHLSNSGAISWCQLGALAAQMAGVPADRLEACPSAELGLPARRPKFSALGSERGWIMPTLEDALQRYMTERHQEPEALRVA